MSAGAIRFMISSTFDMLPSPEFEEMGDQSGVDVRFLQKIKRIYLRSSCEALRPAYTSRHNQKLHELAKVVHKVVQVRKERGPQQVKGITFVKKGQKSEGSVHLGFVVHDVC